jgi:hypothetical protein
MEATTSLLPVHLEPQLRLSVAPCEMVRQDFSIALSVNNQQTLWMQTIRNTKNSNSEAQKLRIVRKKMNAGSVRQKESGRRYRGDAHVGVLRMLLLG